MTAVTDRTAGADVAPRHARPDTYVRGALHIADKVAEKIAATAVREVEHAAGTPSTVLGARVGAISANMAARVSAKVDGSVVTAQVAMSVQWPAPIRDVTRQVRHHITDRVRQLTGLRVVEVDIQVTALYALEPRRVK